MVEKMAKIKQISFVMNETDSIVLKAKEIQEEYEIPLNSALKVLFVNLMKENEKLKELNSSVGIIVSTKNNAPKEEKVIEVVNKAQEPLIKNENNIIEKNKDNNLSSTVKEIQEVKKTEGTTEAKQNSNVSVTNTKPKSSKLNDFGAMMGVVV